MIVWLGDIRHNGGNDIARVPLLHVFLGQHVHFSLDLIDLLHDGFFLLD